MQIDMHEVSAISGFYARVVYKFVKHDGRKTDTVCSCAVLVSNSYDFTWVACLC